MRGTACIYTGREKGKEGVCVCNSQLNSQLKPVVCSHDLECFILLCSCNVSNSVTKDLNDLFCDIRKITPTFINFVSLEEGRICPGYSVVVFTFCFHYIPNYCFFALSFFLTCFIIYLPLPTLFGFFLVFSLPPLFTFLSLKNL